MKHMRKLLALIIAAVMCMAMTVTAFAEQAKANLSVAAVDGHTYTAYQLFVGDLSDGKLSNIKWGADATTSEITYDTDKKVTPDPGELVPADVLDYLATLASRQGSPVPATPAGVAQETANILSGWVKTSGGTVITSTATPVATGYYVVKDAYTDPTADQTTTLSTVVCEVVGPTTITPKAGTTTHTKDVLDINDSDTTLDFTKLEDIDASKWDKTADHDFGDLVPFRLTTKIGSDFAKYDNYYLAVSDTLGNGLALNENSIKVFVDGNEATKGSEPGNYTVSKDGQTFKVEFTKLNAATGAAADKNVVVYYTATLNRDGTNVVIGNDGNPNTSYAEFSNNPNGDQTGKGKTPPETVVVFTYKMDVDKIVKNTAGDDYEAKEGAGFTLYKKYKSEQTDKGANQATALGKTDEFWYAVGPEVSGKTNFEFKGLDDGTYILKETTTPPGFNTMGDLEFNITAQIAEDTGATYGYKITSLSGPTGFAASADGGEFTFTRKKADGNGTEDVTTKIDGTTDELESGEIFGQIINEEGSSLPETGGIGTTIFYVLGAILVVGAGVVLVTRRRMSAN